ncbi:hypothetical protein SEHO0A_02582 [Salmonella enterica subsp. houtenae str. ATCC BAA-1581]|nr:hypothetical protein SEHO0A_02582 [Salmonella enterica subsp. houtenae str. ATCC BAA-1581]
MTEIIKQSRESFLNGAAFISNVNHFPGYSQIRESDNTFCNAAGNIPFY